MSGGNPMRKAKRSPSEWKALTRTAKLFSVACGLALLAGISIAAAHARSASVHAGLKATAKARAKVLANYIKLPLGFQPNVGQTDSRVKFLSRGRGYTLFLTRTEAVLSMRDAGKHLSRPGEDGGIFRRQVRGLGRRERRARASTEASSSAQHPLIIARTRARAANRPSPAQKNARPLPTGRGAVLRIALKGAALLPRIEGIDQLRGKSNYFIGNNPAKWRTNIPSYAKVELRNVYPGIDLIYHGSRQGRLEYDFRLKPGADPNAIRLNFRGEKKLALDRDGNLIVNVGDSKLIQHAPAIYQERDGKKENVAGGWVIRNPHEAGFRLARYDRARALVIDPALIYSTYLGGSNSDSANGIAVDSSGDAYVTGSTSSVDFPATTGAYQAVNNGGGDAFIAKLDPSQSGASSLVYSTYLGGSGSDSGNGIAVDSTGDAYVTGSAGSGFPTTTGAFQSCSSGGAFVTEVNAAGSALIYSTCFGSASGNAIAVDSSGDAYITGSAGSIPITSGAFQSANNGDGTTNAFMAKLDPSKSGSASLVYSTYLGGTGGGDACGFYDSGSGGGDEGFGIAVDSSGDAYVTGATCSTGEDSAFCSGQIEPPPCCTNDSCKAFPTTPGAFERDNPGVGMWSEMGFINYGSNAFVAKLDPSQSGASSLVYSTYLGGSGFWADGDGGNAIAVDSSGDAYVTGYTSSTDFPITSTSALQNANNFGYVAFVTKLNSAGSGLLYSTYLGGDGYDETAWGGGGMGIAVDASDDAYVTGYTTSNSNESSCTGSGTPYSCCTGPGQGCGFPTTSGAFQTVNNAAANGGSNAYVTKLDPSQSGASSLVYSTYLGGSGGGDCGDMANSGDYGTGIAVDPSGNPYVTGCAGSTNFPVTSGAFLSSNNGNSDGFVTKMQLVAATPTPTPTSTATSTPTPTPVPTPTLAPSPTPTPFVGGYGYLRAGLACFSQDPCREHVQQEPDRQEHRL
jgi:Beta-propeller repeat